MSEPDVAASVSAGLDVVRGGLTGLRDSEFWKVSDLDLLGLAREVEMLSRLVFTVQVHLAGEIDTRGIATSHGAASTAALLRTTLGVSQSDARTMVATAGVVLPRDLPTGGELPPALPVLAQAVDEGGIGVAQTRTVVTTMGKLPAEVDAQTRVVCEEQLVAHGRVTEPAPFADFARTILLTLDQDGKDFDEDPPADHVEFTLGTRNPNTGLTRVTGQLDDLGVEIVNQAIDALSKPAPCTGREGGTDGNGPGGAGNAHSGNGSSGNGGSGNGGSGEPGGGGSGNGGSGNGGSGNGGSGNGGSGNGGANEPGGGRGRGKRVPDQRPAATRRAQALLEALRRFLDSGDAPTQGGERPHITVTMTLHDLLGGTTTTGGGKCRCRPTNDPNGDPNTGHDHSSANSQRNGNGAPNRNGAPNGNGDPGRNGGSRTSPDGAATGPPVLEYGGPITPAQARALACDARIIPAVLGGASQVLDVGTSNRLFPPHIRRAITLRDKGCTFPGCDRPPGWTDAHHVNFWVENGKTAYHNGCLLCRRHHSEVHRGHWTITFAPDGVPEYTPPPWVDPSRTPRRNTIHNIPTLLGQ